MIEQKLTRRIALIGPIAGERRAAQTSGFPLDPSKMLPIADVVLLVIDREPGATMLFRYTAHGEFGGDTFHTSSDEGPNRNSMRRADRRRGSDKDVRGRFASSHCG